MKYLPVGILATGALLLVIPGDILPVCFQQIFFESIIPKTRFLVSNCLTTKTLTQWFGGISILCATAFILADSKNVKLSALIGSGMLAMGIFLIYLVWPGFCKPMVLTCRYKAMYIAFAIAIIQLLMSIAGIIKTTRVKT